MNTNKTVKLISEEKSSDYDNYYNVAHAPDGITNVHKFQKITYQNIYNNIDVVFFIPKDTTKVVEYNFIVKPGGKVSDIQLKFNGGKTELVDNKIKMNLRFGQMEEMLPLSWVENGTSKEEISVNYKKIKKNVYGFDGEVNSSNKTIVIDPVPVRLWGTYYGGLDNSYSTFKGDLDSDTNGNLILVGSTSSLSSTFASFGTHQGTSSIESLDGYIAKFNVTGNRVWGTFYGGNSIDKINGVKVDYQNNILVTGETYSATNISTTGTFKQNLSGFADAFIAKFNSNGILVWGSYFGGEADDYSFDIDVDSSNNAYIVGTTRSYNNISINNNFQTLLNTVGTISNGSFDGLIAKFSSNGQIIWSTYCGGDSNDELKTIKVTNNFIVTAGYTLNSSNIATSGAHQVTTTSYIDGIIYKFSLNGNREWSSYYGGEGIDKIRAIETDINDNIYFGGDTNSSNDIASLASFDDFNQNEETGFLVKFNSLGEKIWGTFLGSGVKLYSIKQSSDNIYIGATGSNSGSSNASLTNNCSYDSSGSAEGYIGKFSSSGNFIWGTFVGGFDQYSESKICINNSKISLAGSTLNINNNSITDSNSYQQTFTSSTAYFLMTFEDSSDYIITQNPNVNSPLCAGSDIIFTGPSGFNYQWTGPNSFSSNLQNPVVTNSTNLNSGIYNLIISNNCGFIKNYELNVSVGDSELPIPSIKNLPTINGDCNTNITNIPTANDNCAGIINGSTTDPLTYSTAGTYTIAWSYDDGNGNVSTQTQSIIITATPVPVTNQNFYFCPGQSPTLNDILITGQNIIWYNAPTNGNVLPTTTPLQNGVTYYASQTINGCESDRVPVSVTIQNTPAPTGNTSQSFCSTANATLNEIVSNGTNIIWYDSANGNLVLPNTTTLVDGTTYYASQTVNGCESVARFIVTISLINTLNATDYSESLCDDLNNGFEILNLTNYNSNLITSTGNTFSYYNSLNGAENGIISDRITNANNYNLTVGNSIIYVRIDSPNTCHQVVELDLTLYSKPFLAINDIMPICEGASITISAGNGFDTYFWSTGATTPSITVFQAGNYSVTVSEYHGNLTCSTSKNFTVVNSNIATISQIISSDWTDNENTITVLVNANSDGNYEYSIDGINYQDSPIFNGLGSGEYTVYVNDKNGCGEVKDEVYLLMYPKFFTPNGDGYNDFWKIKFSENEPNITIKIFDRYGKFIKQLSTNSEGWDGTYLGKEAFSTDYWFTVTRENGKEYKGHFTLKR
ncbi:MAG: T9SS type B sorting domain-containing protein [Flavobacterium sp.]|nr:T9SS type B sorting domain-containing protein [Flavobacterium sp.]